MLALFAAAMWFAWLGWDQEYYLVDGVAQGPYRAWQVLGCDAASTDDSGLWVVGLLFLLVGSGLGLLVLLTITAVVAARGRPHQHARVA